MLYMNVMLRRRNQGFLLGWTIVLFLDGSFCRNENIRAVLIANRTVANLDTVGFARSLSPKDIYSFGMFNARERTQFPTFGFAQSLRSR
jgi:hypothetical protein